MCWRHVGGYLEPNCSTAPLEGGKTGHAVQILAGPGRGQWRRVVGVDGARNRTVTLDAAFDPPPTSVRRRPLFERSLSRLLTSPSDAAAQASALQLGPMRGQLLLVGNDFVYGGGMQLYAACYDCVVGESVVLRLLHQCALFS